MYKHLILDSIYGCMDIWIVFMGCVYGRMGIGSYSSMRPNSANVGTYSSTRPKSTTSQIFPIFPKNGNFLPQYEINANSQIYVHVTLDVAQNDRPGAKPVFFHNFSVF